MVLFSIQGSNLGMRRREKLIVIFIGFAFFMICMGAFFYLPKHDDTTLKRFEVVKFLASEKDKGKSSEEIWETLKSDLAKKNEEIGKISVNEVGGLEPISKPPVGDKAQVVEQDETLGQPQKTEPSKQAEPAVNPKLTDEHHQKIAQQVKKEKEKFIEEQKQQEEDIKKQEKQRLLSMTAAPAHHAHGLTTGGEPTDPEVKKKRDFVRNMMKFAWDGYATHAMGTNELKPIGRSGHSAGIFGSSRMGATVVDALDTLHIMGLNDEFKKARDWVAEHLDFNVGTTVSVFEMNIRFVGGLLSAYALTKDEVFKIKAKQLADKLMPAFNTPTGVPWALVNLANGHGMNYGWASGGASILAEYGSLHLEWTYLSRVTGEKVYAEKVNKIRKLMKDKDKPNGLYPNYIDPRSGNWGQQSVSIGALGDSFYEYLIKSWIMDGKKDDSTRKMYDDAMAAVEKHLITKSNGGYTYAGVYNYGMLERKMEHLACFSGGMFGLGSRGAPANRVDRYMEIGAELTRTCHQSYVNTATRIGPESFRFEPPHEAVALRSNERYYILRPEVVESYFVMWRLTHDNKYRDWAWDAVQAIEKNCKIGVGYSGIRDVTSAIVNHDDVQQSFFLAETLKYLYLIFSDDDLISLDEWVFNTEAHPLPVVSN